MTSLDVTAGVNIERALTERNQALIAAEKLRNDFVNHVSYELRTPLTNIIGFTQLLGGRGRWPAQSEAGRICRIHHQFVRTRCSPSSTTFSIWRRWTRARWSSARGRRRRRGDEGGGGGRAGPSERSGDRIAYRHDRRGRHRSAPTAGGCARFCSIFSPTRSAIRSRARPLPWRRCAAATRSCSRSAIADAAFRPR